MSWFDDYRKVNAWANDYSDEEILQYKSNLMGTSPQELAGYVGYEMPKSDMGKELSAGWSNYKAGMQHIGAALGSETAATWARQNEAKAQLMQGASNAPHSYKDVVLFDKDKGLTNYLGQLGASSLPYLGETAVWGAADALTGGALTPAILARYASKVPGAASAIEKATASRIAAGAGEAEARRLATEEVTQGIARTAMVPAVTYPSSLGDVLSNQYEQSGTYDLGSAAALAVPYAGANVLGLESVGLRRGLPLGEMAGGLKSRTARAGAMGGLSMLGEGANETIQEVANQYGRNAVDNSYDPWGEKARDAYAEAFVGGAAMGLGAGGVGGAVSKHTPVISKDQATDLLNQGIERDRRFMQDYEYRLATEADDARTAVAPHAFESLTPGIDVGSVPDARYPGLEIPGIDYVPAQRNIPRTTVPQGDMFGSLTVGEQPQLNQVLQTPGYNDATGDGVDGRILNQLLGEKHQLELALQHPAFANQQAEIQDNLARVNFAIQKYATAQNPTPQLGLSLPTQGVQNGLQQGQKAAQEVNATQPAQVAPQAGQTAQPQTQAQPAAAPANQGVVTAPPKAGKKVSAFVERINAAVATGKLAADHPIINDWKASKQNAGEVKHFNEALDDVLSGPDVAPLTAEQALAIKASDDKQRSFVQEIQSKMSDVHRRVLELYYTQKLTDDEIGAEMGDLNKYAHADVSRTAKIRAVVANAMGRKTGTKRDTEARKSLMEDLEKRRDLEIDDLFADLPGRGYTRQRIQQIRKEAVDHVKAEAAKVGVPAERIDAYFGSEHNRLQGGADVQTVSGAEVAQSGASMHTPGEVNKQVLETEDDAKRELKNEVSGEAVVDEDTGEATTHGELGGFSDEHGEFDTEPGEAVKTEAEGGYTVDYDEYAGFTLDATPDGEPITEADIAAAESAWDELDGSKLNSALKAAWVNLYLLNDRGVISASEYGQYYGKLSSDNQIINAENESAVRQANEYAGSESATGNTGVSRESGESNSLRGVEVKTKKRRTYTPAATEDGVKHSKAEQTGSTTSDAIRSKLKPLFFSGTRFDKIVTVVASTEALPANLRSEVDGNTQAFVQGGKVYMIAGNIAEGKELAVFLHEVGVHLGMAKLIGQENLTRLAMQIKRWATKNDGSQESELAKKALARVKSAQKGGVDMEVGDVIEERVAYFVEEAVNAGVNPQAIAKSGGPIAQWFRTLWAAAKAALRKFGLDRIDSLTPQNLVDLAYGAARMELEGTWHGTAADFRNFNHDYMGSGEGAQAFGWGTYLAQRVGIAKGYWKDDVRRKSVPADTSLKYLDPDALDASFSQKELALFEKLGMDKTPLEMANLVSEMSDSEWKQAMGRILNQQDTFENLVSFASTTPEGSLMRVDTAVHEDEMLDWDKPLSEQSDTVKNALYESGILSQVSWETRPRPEGDPNGFKYGFFTIPNGNRFRVEELPNGNYLVKAMFGGMAERGFSKDGFDREFLGNITQTGAALYHKLAGAKEKGSDKAASEYLDSVGIKGIKFLDSQSRGVKNRAYYQAEIEKLQNKLADIKGQIAFAESLGKSGAALFIEKNQVEDLLWRTKQQLAKTPESETRNLVIFNDKNVQRVSTQVGASRDRIKFSKASEAVERNFGPSGRLAYETVAEAVKGAFRNSTKWLMSLHDLVGRYGHIIPSAGDWHKSVRATDAMRERLKEDAEQIAARASKLSNHVLAKMNEFIFQSTTQQKWGYDAEFAQIDGKMRKVEADPEMARKYDALKSLSPEAAKIAKDVFAHGEQMRLMQFQIMKDLGLKSLTPKSGGTLTGPYAPLKRFGDFVAVLKSQEVLDAEAAHDDKRLAELKKDEKHYVVKFFDTRARAKDFVRRSANYAYAQAFPKRVAVKEAGVGNAALLQKVMGAVKAEGLPADAKARMEDLINDMFLAAFDEQNARTQGLQRKNYAGADEDMIRSFLAGAKAQAGFLAHMKHGATTNELFYKMQSEAGKAKNREESTEVFNAIANHYAESLNYTDTPIQNAVTGATSVWQLATNPAYHVQNLMQPLVVSIPRLAADFGNYSGAWSAWLNGAKTALRIDPRNLDLSKLSENEAGLKGVLRYAEDAGLLNIGMDENIGQFERTRTGIGTVDTSSDLARKALHALRRISSSVEAMNRVSTAVAAYNMAKSSRKFKTEAAIQDYVVSVLQDTQGDFSKTDAPLVIKKLPKPVVQYRKFQLMMAAHYIKAVADLKSESPEVRAVAKRMLAFSLGHAVMTAGALGIPMMNLVALAFSKMGGDDEPWDLERTLREKIGDEHMANMLLHGPLSYMGLDAKLAQDKVFSFLPYADWNLTSKEGVKNLVWGMAGPAGSNLQRVAGGLEYFSKGDTLKGVESVLPSGFANLVRAYHVANEGYTLKNGDVMIRPEDMAGLSMLLDAAGMKSPGMKSAEWFRNQQYEIKEFYQKHTKDIEHAYATAYREGDTEAMASAREDWTALQEGKDRLRYMFNGSMDELKRQPISTLLKYPHTAAKREAKLQKAVPATM